MCIYIYIYMYISLAFKSSANERRSRSSPSVWCFASCAFECPPGGRNLERGRQTLLVHPITLNAEIVWENASIEKPHPSPQRKSGLEDWNELHGGKNIQELNYCSIIDQLSVFSSRFRKAHRLRDSAIRSVLEGTCQSCSSRRGLTKGNKMRCQKVLDAKNDHQLWVQRHWIILKGKLSPCTGHGSLKRGEPPDLEKKHISSFSIIYHISMAIDSGYFRINPPILIQSLLFPSETPAFWSFHFRGLSSEASRGVPVGVPQQWMVPWKIPIENGWWLGGSPMTKRKAPNKYRWIQSNQQGNQGISVTQLFNFHPSDLPTSTSISWQRAVFFFRSSASRLTSTGQDSTIPIPKLSSASGSDRIQYYIG